MVERPDSEEEAVSVEEYETVARAFVEAGKQHGITLDVRTLKEFFATIASRAPADFRYWTEWLSESPRDAVRCSTIIQEVNEPLDVESLDPCLQEEAIRSMGGKNVESDVRQLWAAYRQRCRATVSEEASE